MTVRQFCCNDKVVCWGMHVDGVESVALYNYLTFCICKDILVSKRDALNFVIKFRLENDKNLRKVANVSPLHGN